MADPKVVRDPDEWLDYSQHAQMWRVRDAQAEAVGEGSSRVGFAADDETQTQVVVQVEAQTQADNEGDEPPEQLPATRYDPHAQS